MKRFFRKDNSMNKSIVDYNFTNDLVFKTTIEENPKLAIMLAKMFIKDLKDISIDSEVSFVEKEYGKGVEIKSTLFDVNFEIISDKINYINYEMQNTNKNYLNRRTVKYFIDLLGGAFDKSSTYKYSPSYGVWFLNFKLFNDNEVIHRIEFRNDLTNELWLDNAAIILVEIEKFKNINYNENEKRYYELFTTYNTDDLRGGDEIMNKVADTIQKVNYRKDIRENLRLSDDERRTRNDELEEASDEGIKKGKLEIAKNLKKMNLTIEQIIEATGLSQEEIESL